MAKHGGITKVHEFVKKLGFEKKFVDMILFDAICVNIDRHYGNFGLLRNNHTGEFIDFAPIFDNGESLLAKAMPEIFNNKEEFKKYIEREELNVSYYGDLVKEFCDKTCIKKLRKLSDFKFQKHRSYNIPMKRLNCLSYMIQERAKRFIKVINERENKHE